MQCVVLAGGLGTRMRPLTDRRPKILLDVAGRPFADLQLEWLAQGGVDHVVMSVGHLGNQVREHVGSGARWGLSVDYCDDGAQPRGTAGALRLALDRGLLEERFLVVYGDSYLVVDLEMAWRRFVDSGGAGLMTVLHNRGSWDVSNCDYADGWVTRYEKGHDDPGAAGLHYVDYGLLAFDATVIADLVAPETPLDLAVVQHQLARSGRLAGYEATERFYEIGSPQGLADLEARLRHPGEPQSGPR